MNKYVCSECENVIEIDSEKEIVWYGCKKCDIYCKQMKVLKDE